MNRQEYLKSLDNALSAVGVRDRNDILEEYSEHFDMKAADGFGEEETAARLAPPDAIARQYSEFGSKSSGKTSGAAPRAAIMTGLVSADIFVGSFFVIMYAWVIVLGILSLASAIAGVFTVTGVSLVRGVVLIPAMPYICALLLGISLLALAVLAAFGTEFCRLYVTQMFRAYARWHGSVAGGGQTSPPLPAHPVLKPKKRRIMRNVTLVALVVFAIAFVAGFVSMMIAAGSFEPWHVWGWFS